MASVPENYEEKKSEGEDPPALSQLTSFPFTRQLTFPLLDMMSAHDLLDLNYQWGVNKGSKRVCLSRKRLKMEN